MAAEEVTEARLPFGMGEVDLTSMGAVFTIISLVLGFAVFNMTSSIGDYLAQVANSKLGGVLGVNPATGDDSSPDLV